MSDSRIDSGVMTTEGWKIDVHKGVASIGSVVCAQCEHEPHAATSRPSALRRLLGIKQGPIRCSVLEHDSSGWGAHPCMCDHPIHS